MRSREARHFPTELVPKMDLAKKHHVTSPRCFRSKIGVGEEGASLKQRADIVVRIRVLCIHLWLVMSMFFPKRRPGGRHAS